MLHDIIYVYIFRVDCIVQPFNLYENLDNFNHNHIMMICLIYDGCKLGHYIQHYIGQYGYLPIINVSDKIVLKL